MRPEITAAQQIMTRQTGRYRSLVEGTPEEALNWQPGNETNSIAQLVRHVVAYQSILFGFALDDPPVRNEEEMRAMHTRSLRNDPATRMELLGLLAEMQEHTDADLARLDVMDLDAMVAAFAGRQLERRRLMTQHMLHMAEHAGHAELTKQMWEQRT